MNLNPGSKQWAGKTVTNGFKLQKKGSLLSLATTLGILSNLLTIKRPFRVNGSSNTKQESVKRFYVTKPDGLPKDMSNNLVSQHPPIPATSLTIPLFPPSYFKVIFFNISLIILSQILYSTRTDHKAFIYRK